MGRRAHGDLLNASERAFLATFEDLPCASRALLVRMVMRKGEHFRLARLAYAEIGDTAAALSPLIDVGWVEPDPELTLDELFRQLRLPELRRALADEIPAAGLPAATGKAALYEALSPRLVECRRLTAWWPEAPDRIVRLAVMETCDRLRLMFFGNLRQDWAEFVLAEQEHQALERLRLRPRLRRLGLPPVACVPEPVTERWDLELPGQVASVELAVRDHLNCTEAPVHYVENTLLTGLFGLLCWEALFAPLPGAFFHPFHGGPADLYREDFVARRRVLFDTCLGRLDDGSYREAIRHAWAEKQGIASPFVHWGVLTEALVEQALAGIPTPDLRACFERLMADLKANRAGLPDLIQFLSEGDPAGRRYRLIEVKGPGDRLQDNQRRWLAFFHARGIPAAVCHVRWQDTP